MQLIETIPPAQQPISLDEAKAFLRIIDTDSDVLIDSIITSVVEHTQKSINRQLGVATYELYDESFVSKLPNSPIKEIVSIEYLDASGSYIPLDPSSYYLYEHLGVGHINYTILPDVVEHKKAVKITFVCGYDVVPEPIKSYMKIMISTLFENREEYVIGTITSKFDDRFTKALLDPYRIVP